MAGVKVPVSLPSLLRSCTGGEAEVEVEAATLEGAIAALKTDYPLLEVHLFDEEGRLRQHVHLFYNDREVRWIEDLSLPLRLGDTLTVLQAVSGG